MIWTLIQEHVSECTTLRINTGLVPVRVGSHSGGLNYSTRLCPLRFYRRA
jgi:hypothetical protein